ncbi:hypothetical protein ACHAXS_001672 [Conticribra weissflogii]
MNVINGTLAFKCKQFLNGTVKKSKPTFALLEGIDFFETCIPVVQWTADCLMLILENLLDLKSKQAMSQLPFIMLLLEKMRKSMFQALHFKWKVQGSLFQETFYGLHPSLHIFWKYLTKKLSNFGLDQDPFDPCSFIWERSNLLGMK